MSITWQDRKIWVLTAAAGILLLGFAYAGAHYLYRSHPPLPVVERLSFALPNVASAALLHIAAAKGHFAEEALDVTIVPASHGKEAIELLLQGKADLASAAEVPFVLQVLKGQELSIAATVVSAPNDHEIVARRDRGIATPVDLINKKVGVTFGTSGSYFLWAFLIRNKLKSDSVTLVNVPPNDIVQALSDGTIDAASTWQPIVHAAQSALAGNAVSFAETNAYTELHVVIGSGEYLKQHPKVIEKFVRALLKAEQFIQSRPEEALGIVAKRLKIDARALRPIWNEFKFRVDLQQSQLITLEDETRWAFARGYAATGPVPNFVPHLYLDALLAVQPDRVTVLH